MSGYKSARAHRGTGHHHFEEYTREYMYSGYIHAVNCVSPTRYSLADILVLAGGVIPPAPAVPASTRTSARLKRVQEHSSPVNTWARTHRLGECQAAWCADERSCGVSKVWPLASAAPAQARGTLTDEMPPRGGFIRPETLVLAGVGSAGAAVYAGGANQYDFC